METWIAWAIEWAEKHETFLSLVTVSSALVFLGSLLFIPWLILQVPADYFANPDSDRFNPLGEHPVAIAIVSIVRNTFGIILILIGVALLVLPGQGLLTILLGIVAGQFPGKRRFVYWLVERHQIHRTMNWIRRKGGKPDILLRQRSDTFE